MWDLERKDTEQLMNTPNNFAAMHDKWLDPDSKMCRYDVEEEVEEVEVEEVYIESDQPEL